MPPVRGRSVAFATSSIVSLLCTTSLARAWYFPEHVVLTQDGHAALAPALRTIIGDAVSQARREGLAICERTDVSLEDALVETPLRTPMLRTPASVSCVPYAALPGLAGDHASDVSELRTVLATTKGIELVSAVAYEWRRFQQSALRGQASLDRMSFVHELDVALYFLDAGYVTRARATRVHFRDAGRSFDMVLRDLGVQGRIDEVVARFVFHHMRSLVLAASAKPVEALLDHAFAIHFLEDAFASGHLAMSADSWAKGRDSVRWRHDAFNADGLAVTRAMSQEPCSSLANGSLELAGLSPCWTTSGDGYLSLNADASDRQHIAAALSRTELAFAIALDPQRVLTYANGLGELELLSLGAKLDPSPWWTVDAGTRLQLSAGTKHALRLVQRAAAAARRLRELRVPAPAGVDTPREDGAVDPTIINGALDQPPIVVEEEAPTSPEQDLSAGYAAGVTLLRPTLAQLPASQGDATALRPEGHLDHGWAIQMYAEAAAMVLVPPRSPVDFFGPGVGVSAGFSYRWGTLLPGRRARSIAELNLGLSQTLHVDSRGDSGRNTTLTLLDQELRWPVIWEALTTYTLPLDLAAMHRAGHVLVFNGVRGHEVVHDGAVRFLGLEVEAISVALSNGHGTHPLYALSPELRLYVGLADPSAAQPSFPSAIGPTFGITLIGGYATLL